MNPVLTNLLHTGATSLRSSETAEAELSFFSGPTNTAHRTPPNTPPFADVLARSGQGPEYLAHPFDEPMYSDRGRTSPERNIDNSAPLSNETTRSEQELTRNRLEHNGRPVHASEKSTAAPAEASAREASTSESQVRANEGTHVVETSDADVEANTRRDATASPEASDADTLVTKQADGSRKRSILHRLRGRLATLGVGRSLGRTRQSIHGTGGTHPTTTKHTDSMTRTLRRQLGKTTPIAMQKMATSLVHEMTSDTEPMGVNRQDNNGRNAPIASESMGQSARETAPTTAMASATQATGETNLERLESQRARVESTRQDNEHEPTETRSEGDFSDDTQSDGGQTENVPQENRRANPDKPVVGSRFQAAVKSHAQSAQIRAERFATNMTDVSTTSSAKSRDGTVDLDADTAKLVTRLTSSRGTTVPSVQRSTAQASQAKQTAQMDQLHRQIADHLDKAHAKMSGTRTKLTVHLAELGKVNLQIRMRADGTASGRLQVLMQASEAQTATLLRQGSSALHAVLEAKGYQQPILEVGQASDNAETDLMNRGGNSSTNDQDAHDEATYHDANLAAIHRRQQNPVTSTATGPTAHRDGNGLHVVA